MKPIKFSYLLIIVCVILCLSPTIDGKRKKNKSASQGSKTKTKTKWSNTIEGPSIGPDGSPNPMLATEEHGYYVKRTYLASDGTVRTNLSENASTLKSVPYLAIPIAWFPCPEGEACRNGNSAILNTGLNALSEGFLCDDDCVEPYEPICGRTSTEIAVFYNKCKLNVAKCRTHGYWMDLPYEECLKTYPKELEYTEQKFKSSPFFKSKNNMDDENKNKTTEIQENATLMKGEAIPEIAFQAALVGDKIENTASKIEATKVKPNEANIKI